jgi:Ca-activated chloride channel family protein
MTEEVGPSLGVGSGPRRTGPLPPEPETTIVDVHVEGGLSHEEARRILRRHLRELAYCYSRYIEDDASTMLVVSVGWDVSEEGRVTDSRLIESSHGHTRLEECVVRAFRRWAFPEPTPSGAVQATATLRFAPRATDVEEPEAAPHGAAGKSGTSPILDRSQSGRRSNQA